MRNTPKSESLLRARAEREERTGSSEHPAGGAPNPGEDSSSSEPGGTQRQRHDSVGSVRALNSRQGSGKYARGDPS